MARDSQRERNTVEKLASDSLALSLALAARACQGVRDKHSLTDTLASALESGEGRRATAAARAAAQDLAFFTMRWRGRGDALLTRVSNRTPDPAVVAELLIIALLLLDAKVGAQNLDDAPHYAPHTLVDQAVEAAGALAPEAGARALRGFVNAVLRRAPKDTA